MLKQRGTLDTPLTRVSTGIHSAYKDVPSLTMRASIIYPDYESMSLAVPIFLKTSTTHNVSPAAKLALGALVIGTLVLTWFFWRALGDADAGLYGFWEIDSTFAERANVDKMYMYIGAPDGHMDRAVGLFGERLKIFVLIMADGEYKHNSLVEARVARRSIRLDARQKYNISFDAPVSIIPKSVTAEFYPVTQMLVIRDSKRVYARLFKKPEVSFYCTGTAESEGTKSKAKAKVKPARVTNGDNEAGENTVDEAMPDDQSDGEPADNGSDSDDA